MDSKAKGAGRYAIANASAITMTVFLGVVSVIGAVADFGGTVPGSVLFTIISLVLLGFAFTVVSDFSKLAFFAPCVMFVLNSIALTVANEQHVYFYLLACLFICGISCLYTNFSQTLLYVVLQTATIFVLHFAAVPVAGHETITTAAQVGILLVFVLACLSLLILNKSTTASLSRATQEASSFRTYLSTTKDYLAMLDGSNRIVYVSKPLSDLARIGNPELTKGRPFVDLFPSRELKLFAHNMLGRYNLHERDWDFVLNRQKRYFKAVSSGMAGGGTLITMLDMTHLAERDEIAAMRDSLKIGIFFMDGEFAIMDNYSRHLEELLSDSSLKGKRFTDLIAASVSPKELETIRDYLKMVFDRTFDQETLREINPVHELRYVGPSGLRKIFQCEFLSLEAGKDGVAVLVTIYDITTNVELQERLQKEEKKRQEEMSNLFELLQVPPPTFEVFQEDMAHEFERVDAILGRGAPDREALVEIYQAVHSIKSNAVTLGLRTFGAKAHDVESQIKRLRDAEGEVPDTLHLALELERLAQEKEAFKQTLARINAFKTDDDGGAKSEESVLVESLARTAGKVAADMGKKARVVAADIDPGALAAGPRRVIKEALVQLVRNSVAHGVEAPEERAAAGKSEAGTIRLSIKRPAGGGLTIRLADDGRGLDFGRIREKALGLGLVKEEDAGSKGKLLNAIFAPGFSTADDGEGMHAGRGIGLNLVRDRVRGAGGSIKIQTEPGKGTAFSLVFAEPGGPPAGPTA